MVSSLLGPRGPLSGGETNWDGGRRDQMAPDF